jgi:hypothetical protein
MGTNFFLISSDTSLSREDLHIGKRSAAGLYCWDCDRTLCVGGNRGVHRGDEFLSHCPQCGKGPDTEGVESSSVGRELGFNNGPFELKKGVRSCSSFTWAVEPEQMFLKIITSLWENPNFFDFDLFERPQFEDEYGRQYSFQEFHMVLKECPIRFYDMIGKEFC